VVVEVRWRRRGGHGVEADGLGALLGERVAEGAVRDEAVPPAHCIALHATQKEENQICCCRSRDQSSAPSEAKRKSSGRNPSRLILFTCHGYS